MTASGWQSKHLRAEWDSLKTCIHLLYTVCMWLSVTSTLQMFGVCWCLGHICPQKPVQSLSEAWLCERSLHRDVPPPPSEQRPPPHSWKSTINHVSSKPDTSPRPAHPHGDHYENLQACVLWPNRATHEETESLYFTTNMDQNVAVLSALFAWREDLAAALVDIWLAQTEKKKPRRSPRRWCFTASVFCEPWRQRSRLSDTVAFVLESPHLIHSRLTPESEGCVAAFQHPWFLNPLVFKELKKIGHLCPALCELLTCKTRPEDAEWLKHRGAERVPSKVTAKGQRRCSRGAKEQNKGRRSRRWELKDEEPTFSPSANTAQATTQITVKVSKHSFK